MNPSALRLGIRHQNPASQLVSRRWKLQSTKFGGGSGVGGKEEARGGIEDNRSPEPSGPDLPISFQP